jgi:hypothetical protein
MLVYVLYSPATIREAKWREKVKQDEAEAEKLQKKRAESGAQLISKEDGGGSKGAA